MNKEEWRPIKGYIGIYEVSNLGRVRSLDHYVVDSIGREKLYRGAPVKAYFNAKVGYMYIDLHKNGSRKHMRLHRVVAGAFISNPNNYSEINHIDENTKNNTVGNLEWCSREYNCNYGNRNKHQIETNDRKNPRLRRQPVIATNISTGETIRFSSQMDASRELGLPQGNIGKCCRNEISETCGWNFERM